MKFYEDDQSALINSEGDFVADKISNFIGSQTSSTRKPGPTLYSEAISTNLIVWTLSLTV